MLPSSTQAAITKLKTRRDVTGLIKALDDEDLPVRYAAISALGEIGDPLAVEALCSRLEDEDSDVSAAAAEALGEIGDARAVEPLCIQLTTTNYIVQQKAALALEKIGAPAVGPLCRVLGSTSKQSREVAAKALLALYRSDRIDETGRANILSARSTVPETHLDRSRRQDTSGQGAGPGTHFGEFTVHAEPLTDDGDTSKSSSGPRSDQHTDYPGTHTDLPGAHVDEPGDHSDIPGSHTDEPDDHHTDWTGSHSDVTTPHTDYSGTHTDETSPHTDQSS